jgi:hypothetical protein
VRINANLVLALALAAVFGGALALATTFPPGARIFPYLIGGLGLVLALAATLVESRPARPSDAPTPAVADDGARPAASGDDRRREISTAAWIFGFFAAVGLVGFQGGLPVAVALYYAFECRLRPVTAAVMGLAAAAFVYLVVHHLNMPLYEGVLFSR